MSGSLSPVVHRGRPYGRRILVPYALGSLVGGAALGALLAGVAASSALAAGSMPVRIAVAAVIAVYAACELVGRSLPRPNTTRQVPEGFRRTPYVSTTAFLFAADLGFGWTTQQRSPAFLVFCLVAITLDPDFAFATGVAFGLARGLTLVSGWRLKAVDHIASRYRPLYRRERAMNVAASSAGLVASLLLIV